MAERIIDGGKRGDTLAPYQIVVNDSNEAWLENTMTHLLCARATDTPIHRNYLRRLRNERNSAGLPV